MTTYNTGNPLGSKDPRDLYDNAENFDAAINDVENPSFEDRFGRQRTTLKGYDDQFQQFLINSGYENIGDYAAGLEITARNQIFWRDGELYRAGAALELPYTTTGDWGAEEGLFVAVGDAALRDELFGQGGTIYWRSPEMFDGVGDTEKIQAALDAGEGIVDLGGRTYHVRTITVNSNRTLQNGTLIAEYDVGIAVVYSPPGTINPNFYKIRTEIDTENLDLYVSDNISGIQADGSSGVRIDSCVAIGSKCNVYTLNESWGCGIHTFECIDVEIKNSTSIDADKEGIMAKRSDNVRILDCIGRNAGQSNIGTSGGNIALVRGCESYNSGNTGITVNSQKSIVIECRDEGSMAFNGILIGHDHETLQYAEESMVVGCMSIGGAGNGICITQPTTAVISGNVVDDVGLSGILVLGAKDKADISISGNSITRAAAGSIYAATLQNEANIVITGNIASCSPSAIGNIRATFNGNLIISDNIAEGGDRGVEAYEPDTGLPSESISNITVSGNTFKGAGRSGVDLRGGKRISVLDNKFTEFNENGDPFGYFIVTRTGRNAADYIDIRGNSFDGVVSPDTEASIVISGDSLSKKSALKVKDNFFSDTTKPPVVYPLGRFDIDYFGNQRGTDPSYVFTTSPTTVMNSNATTFSSPILIPRDSGDVRVQSINNGSVVLVGNGNVNLRF